LDSNTGDVPPPVADSQNDQDRGTSSGSAASVIPKRPTQPRSSTGTNIRSAVQESNAETDAGSTPGLNAVPTPEGGIDERGSGGGRGEVLGYATLTGTPKPEIPIEMGQNCGSLNAGDPTTRHFVVGGNSGLANVLVYIRNTNLVGLNAAPAGPPLLDQIGCMYEPYVMGVLVGQKFTIRNSDPVLHNVHATPKLNREFNLGQPLQGQTTERSFDTPELFIRIKCDVHPWMFAYVNVMPHPFFAITDTNGFFRLPAGLPAGNYQVSAAHLKAGEFTQEIMLQEGGQKTLSFQFNATPGVPPQGGVVKSN